MFGFRQSGQETSDDVSRRDFRKELEERERAVAREKRGDRGNRGQLFIIIKKTLMARLVIVISILFTFVYTIF